MNNLQAFIDEISGLTSDIDKKVRLEFQKGQSPGQWSSIRFNSYCYEKSSNQQQGGLRACAMIELFGRAAKVCLKYDPKCTILQMRSYYKDAQGITKPNLHISITPEANQTAAAPAAVDFGARVAEATTALMKAKYDFSANPIPDHFKSDRAMLAVYLESLVAGLETKTTGEVPAIDADQPDV